MIRPFTIKINQEEFGVFDKHDWDVFQDCGHRKLVVYEMDSNEVAIVNKPIHEAYLGKNDTLMVTYHA